MQVLTVNYQSKDAAKLFCQSLHETGFGVLTHHPVAPELIQAAYSEWQNFFNSSQKHEYLYKKETQDGYFPFRSETAKNYKVSDLKEFFHFYPWGQIPESLKQISTDMYEQMSQLSVELLQWIEDNLPADVANQLHIPLSNMIQNSDNTLLRILHYPPLPNDVEPGAIRAAAHEDINLITLLPAATAPGLEVLDANGKWHMVSCDPGNIVVNVGDMLQMCTRKYYISTTHRVINPIDQVENTSRYSMPLFLHPRNEVRLSETHTAIEYRHERLREIGIY